MTDSTGTLHALADHYRAPTDPDDAEAAAMHPVWAALADLFDGIAEMVIEGTDYPSVTYMALAVAAALGIDTPSE